VREADEILEFGDVQMTLGEFRKLPRADQIRIANTVMNATLKPITNEEFGDAIRRQLADHPDIFDQNWGSW